MHVVDESGVIFDLQRFSVHDGPGIRSLVFFKGCPLHCTWCSNPESYRHLPELLFDPVKCLGCRACVTACTSGAVQLKGDMVSYDRAKCHACGLCAVACNAEARVLSGMTVTADWVIAEVMKDEPFFANSGGGVTLGGGEPLAQPEFARAIVRGCQGKGVHTAIETCGHVPWTSLEMVLPWTNLFLFDFKHLDRRKHHTHTGGDVTLIQSNLEKLASARRAVIVRIPVIPTFNAEPDEIAAMAERVAALGLSQIHLLPYHAFGQSKYRLLGKTYPFAAKTKVSKSQLDELSNIVVATGLRVNVGS